MMKFSFDYFESVSVTGLWALYRCLLQWGISHEALAYGKADYVDENSLKWIYQPSMSLLF